MTPHSDALKLQVGGAVNLHTSVYIVRPPDHELLRLLARGEYCNVLCSRQMGKTSLLKRTRARLTDLGYATAEIDVAGYLGSPPDPAEWYQGLLQGMARQLSLQVDVRAWWQTCDAVTLNQHLLLFFHDEVAVKVKAPVVVFLDEIDSTLKLPYTDDFFVAIRTMYNDRASEPVYERITFCLIGVATPNELIKDRRTTPYNIGRTIEL
jgi:adenylate cyclase